MRIGDLLNYNNQPHVLTAVDFIFRKATLRFVDDEKPIGERFGEPVEVLLRDLPDQSSNH